MFNLSSKLSSGRLLARHNEYYRFTLTRGTVFNVICFYSQISAISTTAAQNKWQQNIYYLQSIPLSDIFRAGKLCRFPFPDWHHATTDNKVRPSM